MRAVGPIGRLGQRVVELAIQLPLGQGLAAGAGVGPQLPSATAGKSVASASLVNAATVSFTATDALSGIAPGSVTPPNLASLTLLVEEGGSIPTVYAHHTEPDMRLALSQPWCSIGSDGSAYAIEGTLRRGNPHPRNFGTFPRVLGVYVRENQLLRLEDAVRGRRQQLRHRIQRQVRRNGDQRDHVDRPAPAGR